jgi:adenosine deaminase
MNTPEALKSALSSKKMEPKTLEAFLRAIPKAELHLHIEGSLEPEMLFELARKNGVTLGYSSPKALKAAYSFSSLDDFLSLYYKGVDALRTKQDFFDLAWGYYLKAKAENIKRAEIFCDPQANTLRVIPFEDLLAGLVEAKEKARGELGVSSGLILCFLRHLSEQEALETLEKALPYKKEILGVGLDSSELGNPPSNFRRVFQKAKDEGFLPTAHAGEEAGASYVWEALNELKAVRIDHGVRSEEDSRLMAELKTLQVPLTVCPLSNVKLRVFDTLKDHNLKRLLDYGLLVTLNSDDPAYFGGYLMENYLQSAQVLDLNPWDLYTLAKNSIIASFLPKCEKQALLEEQERILEGFL